MTKSKVVFAGTGTLGAAILPTILSLADIPLVITQAGDKENPVQGIALAQGLVLEKPQRIEALENEMRLFSPDLLIVADYGQILPKRIVDLARLGTLNVHPSLLPRHRGPSPITAVILSGDEKTGVTLIRMDEKMDHGPIIAQEEYMLSGRERADDLKETLSARAAQLLQKTLLPYLAGEIVPQPQQDAEATFHKLLTRDDGRISAQMTAEEIERRFRAFYSWPGTWTEIEAEKPLRIKFLGLLPTKVKSTAPGQLAWNGQHLLYEARDFALIIETLQVAGGKAMSGESFFRGYQKIVRKL